MMLNETFQLANGTKIPKIGFGTWQMPPDDAYRSTKYALDNGYKHVDTAYVYGNETDVGRAIKDSSVSRDEIFITTKVPAETDSYEEAMKNIDESLRRLAVEHVDLLLIHAPRPWSRIGEVHQEDDKKNIQVWKALEDAYQEGKAKAIGVSNFNVDDLKNIIANGKVKPMVNQIKCYIGNLSTGNIEFCQNNSILVEGYSPLATGGILDDKKIKKIAEKYNKSIPQVAIRYLLQKDILPLPKSVHETYILENAQVDFVLEKEDMYELDQL
ncbi:aldo/keto reductase [Tetragenococcus solitarius]|uniref:Aldo/keto reductase n=1 Tax=Tetragenococcus solitarius TaxID=71453 RepID=A0ABN3YDM5_9ENTE|nr:aldo/keto reductase [Tetragenococcus solitarius]